MLNWFTRRRQNKRIASEIYGSIVALSRQPALYRSHKAPDTVEGRFEVLLAHLFLFLDRIARDVRDTGALEQELVDRFFADMDTSQRELGVGDLAMPKKMRKLAVMFDERLDAYRAAVGGACPDELEKVLDVTVFSDRSGKSDAALFGRYMHRLRAALDGRTLDALCDTDDMLRLGGKARGSRKAGKSAA